MSFFCLNKCATWFTDKCYKTTVMYILVISLATLISPKKKKMLSNINKNMLCRNSYIKILDGIREFKRQTSCPQCVV